MKNQIIKDKKKRNLQLQFEKKQKILKSISKNESLTKITRWNSNSQLSILNSNSYSIKLVRRCIITGRKNILNKMFKISRLAFLKLARNGLISGIKKASW